MIPTYFTLTVKSQTRKGVHSPSAYQKRILIDRCSLMAKKVSRKSAELLQDFESVAKRLGADEDKDRFEAKLGKIAKAKSIPRNEGAKHK